MEGLFSVQKIGECSNAVLFGLCLPRLPYEMRSLFHWGGIPAPAGLFNWGSKLYLARRSLSLGRLVPP
jgi:hypothetical protein